VTRRRSRRPILVGILALVTVIGGCSPSPTPPPPAGSGVADAPTATARPTVAAIPTPATSPSPSSTPEPSPWTGVTHDPGKFGFVAKGMSHEVMAFVTVSQIPYARKLLDYDAVSTIAFFSLQASHTGAIAHDKRFEIWNSVGVDEMIVKAHEHGTKVVVSVSRFSWSAAQTADSRAVLANPDRRKRLAREIAAEVVRRGIDGVNVDFEPIPVGQKENFTRFVRALRAELDAVGPAYQLTFAVTGHHESYDVASILRPGGADAVYLMGYHYAGTFSTIAASTAPMGGGRYDVADTVRLLLKAGRPEQIIVGVPYYGHLWPTASGAIHARPTGKGVDVLYEQAAAIAAARGSRYDRVEQVSWSAFRSRSCAGCPLEWHQLYFDDARSLAYKWDYVKKQKLLGTGIWAIGYEGRPDKLNAALREAFLSAAD
jgi:spore germination protein YaaH